MFAKLKKAVRNVLILIAVLVVGVIAIGSSGSSTATAPAVVKSPEQIAAEAKAQAEFASSVIRIRALKSSMKNPSSFELVEALHMDDGTVCVEYRARNSFNALVLEQKAISSKGAFVNWNKSCAGKSGTVVTHARQAI